MMDNGGGLSCMSRGRSWSDGGPLTIDQTAALRGDYTRKV